MLRGAATRGMTLTEVLVASVLAVVVIIGIGSIDMTRIRITQDIRNPGLATSELTRAALAAQGISSHLLRADRLNMVEGSLYQARIPSMTTTGCTGAGVVPDQSCLDDPLNYRWDEYVLDGDQLVLYTDTRANKLDPNDPTPQCSAKIVLASQIQDAAVTFHWRDVAPPPPGGDPFPTSPDDNNVVSYSLTWDDGAGHSQTFPGTVTIRGGSYSNVNTGGAGVGDSGTGLIGQSGIDLSPPPTSCVGKIICTELYHQGYIPAAWYAADVAYSRAYIDDDTRRSYFAWAQPLVASMRRAPWVTRLVRPFGVAWAQHMAYKMGVSERDNLLGRLLNDLGVPLNRAIGKHLDHTR